MAGIDGVLIDEAADLRDDWFTALHQAALSSMKWLLLLDHDQQAHPHALGAEHVWWQTQLPQAVRFACQDTPLAARAGGCDQCFPPGSFSGTCAASLCRRSPGVPDLCGR